MSEFPNNIQTAMALQCIGFATAKNTAALTFLFLKIYCNFI